MLLLSALPVSAEVGVASVYWPGSLRWGGARAANGERLDFGALTVAHPQAAKTGPMPFGTCLELIYGKRKIVARVNDNGPHVKNRKIDMTPAVAKALRFPGLGVVRFNKVPCA